MQVEKTGSTLMFFFKHIFLIKSRFELFDERLFLFFEKNKERLLYNWGKALSFASQISSIKCVFISKEN
jgi:hypothetical protein